MGALENAISEEIALPPPQTGRDGESAWSSERRKAATRADGLQARAKTNERNKVIAAAVGATLTSLTMTPFDVLKTRLQTQPDYKFVPSSHLPKPSANTPWPPPIPSTSTSLPPQYATTRVDATARRIAASSPAACCTKTYFSSNADKNVVCRFDPRVSTSQLPGTGSHATSLASSASKTSANSTRHAPMAFVHHLAPANLFAHSPATGAVSVGPNGASVLTSPSCLYPTVSDAAIAAVETGQRGANKSARHFTGFWDAVIKITKHEGVSALWRGTAPALAMSVPGQIVYMVGYDWGRRTLLDNAPQRAYQPLNFFSLANSDRSGSVTMLRPDGLAPWYLTAVPLLAGSLSRTVVAVLTSPLELIRTRLQSSSSNLQISDVLASMRRDGLSSAWRGLPPTLWRDVPFSGIYWAGYEGIKRMLTGGKGMGEGWENQGIGREFGVAFISGAGSGMIAATFTNPFDVVKTRRQALESSASSPTRTFPLLVDIFRKEGMRGLMSGLTPRLAKIGPACGIMIASYEGLALVLDKREN
ncbi:Carrier protein, mitochondrial [Microbotryomycetes sp. JL201]|nr:Carrier protein, mitochondrial [Microbotryomycetes sp. JL201]